MFWASGLTCAMAYTTLNPALIFSITITITVTVTVAVAATVADFAAAAPIRYIDR